MRKEDFRNEPVLEDPQVNAAGNDPLNEAFQYLRSLPPNHDRPALDSYKRERTSNVIDHDVAEFFTDKFRSTEEPFYIPVSWSMTKAALINLLGITSYEGHECVNGIRFYTGVNCDKQLTLIAVSTIAGNGCDDDLTVAEQYPYYDYADPCPSSCSSRGNLRAETPAQKRVALLP